MADSSEHRMNPSGKSVRSHGGDESLIWHALRHVKYRLKLVFGRRTNRVYTRFFRFPHQYKALEKEVIPFLLNGQPPSESQPLDIIVFACGNGAEPYSLSSVLLQKFPGLRFRIRAFDIVEEVIDVAKAGAYPREEVLRNPLALDEFIEVTFDEVGAFYRVKPEVARPVSFSVGSLLDAPFMQDLGKVDIAVAQNVLFHLPRPKARVAFANLTGLLKPRSAVFINGMDTDMRISLTKRHGLVPLDYLIEEIHEDARVDRPSGWAGAYWGREPFSRRTAQWVRKFSTIFLRNEP